MVPPHFAIVFGAFADAIALGSITGAGRRGFGVPALGSVFVGERSAVLAPIGGSLQAPWFDRLLVSVVAVGRESNRCAAFVQRPTLAERRGGPLGVALVRPGHPRERR